MGNNRQVDKIKRNNLSILTALFLISILLGSCSEDQYKKRRKEWEKRKIDIVETLSNRYQPIVLPLRKFREKQIFTYNLEDSFINQGKSVLFTGYLDDITKNGNHFAVRFITSPTDDPFMEDRRIIFHLKCRYEDVKSFLNKPPEWDISLKMLLEYNFCVVCRIMSVKKILKYTVSGYSSGEDEVVVEIETPDFFLANGELIEIVELGFH